MINIQQDMLTVLTCGHFARAVAACCHRAFARNFGLLFGLLAVVVVGNIWQTGNGYLGWRGNACGRRYACHTVIGRLEIVRVMLVGVVLVSCGRCCRRSWSLIARQLLTVLVFLLRHFHDFITLIAAGIHDDTPSHTLTTTTPFRPGCLLLAIGTGR